MNFKVTIRLVRDRYTLLAKLVKKYNKKWGKEKKASCINSKHTEIDDALLDMILTQKGKKNLKRKTRRRKKIWLRRKK